ncbi:MAG: hypothetical protein J7K29_03060 [Candidatus Cloacimonetes bacterium]|nr:hypothetical protein [Candidatus Cloacimonadota bacterium]
MKLDKKKEKEEKEKNKKGNYKVCKYCGARMYKKDMTPAAWAKKKFCSEEHKNKYYYWIQNKKKEERDKFKEKFEIQGIKEINKLRDNKPIPFESPLFKKMSVQLPTKYHKTMKTFTNFKSVMVYISPQINVRDFSTKLHISVRVLVRGYWAYASVFNISEKNLIKFLKAMKEYKEKVKNAKGKIKINERGVILEV